MQDRWLAGKCSDCGNASIDENIYLRSHEPQTKSDDLFLIQCLFSCCSCAWNILILIIVIAIIAAVAIALGVYFGVYNTEDPELNQQITDSLDSFKAKLAHQIKNHH